MRTFKRIILAVLLFPLLISIILIGFIIYDNPDSLLSNILPQQEYKTLVIFRGKLNHKINNPPWCGTVKGQIHCIIARLDIGAYGEPEWILKDQGNEFIVEVEKISGKQRAIKILRRMENSSSLHTDTENYIVDDPIDD